MSFFNKDKGQDDTELPESLQGDGKLWAIFTTSMGKMVVELFDKKAPRTVANFVGLAMGSKTWTDPRTRKSSNEPLYNGTIFHRVIPNFMIQAGDPLGQGTGGPGYKFKDEFHPDLKHDKPGVLSMANSGRNTNGSQFFITEVPTAWLDNKHAIFGHVVEGLELIPQITNVPRNHMDRPVEDVKLLSVEIIRSETQPQA